MAHQRAADRFARFDGQVEQCGVDRDGGPQPGFITLRMHRGTAGSRLLMNIAVWESTEALATALGSPEVQRMAADFPDDIVSYPHIFEPIDV
ncbi:MULTISPECIES: antibiotic biosynthesis monooxygenase family protein [unclassified Streptomyces]|uniref:antibiotic biosynthesis monooxygenase family protein n=1 Tax=unclassified Streptomyces TaxID=2593676 RepID=UPI00214B0AA8|nr:MULTISPECIES: antibiotic biosynthesis monooxygenase [unclassified Streptomyces]